MATKKIPELPSYGSRTFLLSKKDLIEISKAEGTYGFPTYGTGTSRNITFEEFTDAVGGIPYSGQNYEVVKATGSDTENGTNLIVAYLSCYAKEPNGNPLSATNRATVYFFTGRYNIGATIINVGEFVDFIGIGTAESILIYGNTGNSVFFIEDDNDYHFANFSVENTSTGKSLSHDFGATDYGIWDNVIFLTATNRDIIWNGIYNRVQGKVDEVMIGSFDTDSVISNSTFQNKSCGYSETDSVFMRGRMFNVTGVDYCFGYSSFGDSEFSGSAFHCEGRDYCFAMVIEDSSSAEISGTIKNSSGRNFCFATTSSGSATASISGEIIDCSANATSYAYSATDGNQSISGIVSRCRYGAYGDVYSSPDAHKWRKTIDNTGEWQTEDLGL